MARRKGSKITNDLATNILPQYKFKKPTTQVESCRTNVLHRQDHDDDALPEEESSAKRCTSSEEYAYHLDQIKSYMENHIVWESRAEELTMQVLDNPVLVYQGCDRNPNAPTRYLYNKDLFYLKYGNSKIREKEFMKEIIVKRVDGEMCSFLESYNKYLNKNDIKDWYLMCLNVKINYRENGEVKSLNVFIRSSVIWERVHDYQLGLERYQLKVNLIAPTLTVPGIEDLSPYSIIALPIVGLVYKNSKIERRVMDINEIPKFYNVTLKRVLENVKKINLDVKHDYKDPPLSKEDAELMKFYEEHIQERLKHRDQMKRWESYVNRIPIQNLRERPEESILRGRLLGMKSVNY
nr:hypothetical protein [Tanacetum cinerariifolium]